MTSPQLLELTLTPLLVDPVVKDVFAIGRFGHVRDLDLGKHVDAPTPGEGQVIHIQRVLGPDVAARKAVTTVDARFLLDTDMVGALVTKMNSQRQ